MEDDYFRRGQVMARLFMIGTFLLACGAGIGLVLAFTGKPTGLGLVALCAAIWVVSYLARRRVTGDEL
ncbi:hypothetical protein JQK87_04685 [Streptomyces sp. G44]|uniref:hypothetical protein n=1 Tax=Streptomyces sp. G44 TaxID=2807632 RepID=UPI0019620CFE|nr:hypothetical protein [Streptomyces sp. G44]MBM7167714.1 hypothetical protein [Streptomyces sp. G44]